MKFRNYYKLYEAFPTFTKTQLQNLTTTYSQTNPTYSDKFAAVIDTLADRYYDWYVGFVDKSNCEDPSSQDITDNVIKPFIKKFAVIYKLTADRYSKLLDLYTATQNDLLAQLSNTISETGSNRTNDTPQNGGDWTDDEHTSVYISSSREATTTYDPQTVMSRLDEIQAKYRNLLEDWSDEFKDLFWTAGE